MEPKDGVLSVHRFDPWFFNGIQETWSMRPVRLKSKTSVKSRLTSPCKNKALWPEPSEANARRSVLCNNSSQSADAKKWSILVIVGDCWSLHQVYFLPLRSILASSRLSTVDLNLLIIGRLRSVLFSIAHLGLNWSLPAPARLVGKVCANPWSPRETKVYPRHCVVRRPRLWSKSYFLLASLSLPILCGRWGVVGLCWKT